MEMINTVVDYAFVFLNKLERLPTKEFFFLAPSVVDFLLATFAIFEANPSVFVFLYATPCLLSFCTLIWFVLPPCTMV